jgi:hypothetical protein
LTAHSHREGAGAQPVIDGHNRSDQAFWINATCRERDRRAQVEVVIDVCFAELEPLVGTDGACRGSGKGRATHYRRCQPARLSMTPPKER